MKITIQSIIFIANIIIKVIDAMPRKEKDAFIRSCILLIKKCLEYINSKTPHGIQNNR